MKHFMAKRSLVVIAALVFTAVLFGPMHVRAASIICPNDIGFNPPISDNVSNSTGCEIGSTNNDSVSQVNIDTMFDFGDWALFSATNGSITGLGDLAEPATSGSLGLGGVDWTTFGNLMIVFKDGNGEPDTYVGYLIEDGYTGSISWTTPFLNPVGDTAKDVSHINAYVRGIDTPPSQPIPEPTSMLLLGTGLVGLARICRKRKTTPAVPPAC